MSQLSKSMLEFAHGLSLEERASYSVLWLENMRDNSKWGLSQAEACELLGGITPNTYRKWLANSNLNKRVDSITRDQFTRLSLLLGIHKALSLSAPEGFSFEFFSRPIDNPKFKNKSAKELLIENPDIMTMYAVRNFFDARRA